MYEFPVLIFFVIFLKCIEIFHSHTAHSVANVYDVYVTTGFGLKYRSSSGRSTITGMQTQTE